MSLSKNPVTKEEVAKALADLKEQGKRPTIEALRARIGRGSATTLLRLRGELIGNDQADSARSPEAEAAFVALWKTAFSAGSESKQAELDQLQADMGAVESEVRELARERDDESNRADQAARTAQTLGEQLAEARREVSEARAAAQSAIASEQELKRQVADLERELLDAKRRAEQADAAAQVSAEQLAAGRREVTEIRAAAQASAANERDLQAKIAVLAEQLAETERRHAAEMAQMREKLHALDKENAVLKANAEVQSKYEKAMNVNQALLSKLEKGEAQEKR